MNTYIYEEKKTFTYDMILNHNIYSNSVMPKDPK